MPSLCASKLHLNPSGSKWMHWNALKYMCIQSSLNHFELILLHRNMVNIKSYSLCVSQLKRRGKSLFSFPLNECSTLFYVLPWLARWGCSFWRLQSYAGMEYTGCFSKLVPRLRKAGSCGTCPTNAVLFTVLMSKSRYFVLCLWKINKIYFAFF